MATEGETKPRYYILDKMPKKIHTFFHVNKSKEEKMDENDIQILNTISLNAREPYANLARITNLTPRIIRYRRNDLTKRKIITGSKLVINYRKLGYLFFKCFITFKNSNEKRYNTFKSYIRNHPNMIYWIKTIGSWDLELEIEIPSIEKFYEVVDELKETFPDIIGSFDASLVSKEHAIMHV